MMNRLKKMTALSLSLCLAFWGPPEGWAAGAALGVPAEDGERLSASVGVSEIPPAPETGDFKNAPTEESVMDFLMQGPLSPAESEEPESEEAGAESDDPYYGSQGTWNQSYDDLWWHKKVDAEEAWRYGTGEGVTIAVIDTGVDFTHPDLQDSFWINAAEAGGQAGVDDDGNGFVDDIRGWDFYNDDNDPTDDQGHGSHVAGIAGANAGNQEGIAGIAPDVTILPVKALNSSGSGYISDIANAITYAADAGADIINMSLGAWKSYLSAGSRQKLEAAVAYALEKGTVVVTSAGNSNTDANLFYPSAIEGVLNVAALSASSDTRAWFSNYGDILDVIAPGTDVLSLRASGTDFGADAGSAQHYSRASGTSMAAPVVAGIVALMLSWDPRLEIADIFRRIHFSALDLGAEGFDQYYGYGLVNAAAAVAKDFFETGELKTWWLAETDEDGFVHYEYDLTGRIIRKTSPNNDYVLLDYRPGTGTVLRAEYHDRYTLWLKTAEYYEDGTSVFREYFPNGDYFEYDRDGNRVTFAEGEQPNVVFPAVQGMPPTQLFLRQQQQAAQGSTSIFDPVSASDLPIGLLDPLNPGEARLLAPGVASGVFNSFRIGDSAFRTAEEKIEEAKEEGRNLIFMDLESSASGLVTLRAYELPAEEITLPEFVPLFFQPLPLPVPADETVPAGSV